MPCSRAMASATFFAGAFHVCGGRGEGNAALATCDVYDAAGGAWTATASQLVQARWGHAAAALEGHLYVFGGYGPDDQVLASIERFDGTTWQLLDAVLPTPLAHLAAGNVGDQLYLMGGCTGRVPWGSVWPEGSQLQDSIYLFSGSELTLSHKRLPFPVAATHLALTDPQRLLLAGGVTAAGWTERTNFFNVGNGSFIPGPSLPRTYQFPSVAKAGNRLLLVGGNRVWFPNGGEGTSGYFVQTSQSDNVTAIQLSEASNASRASSLHARETPAEFVI